MLFDIFDNPIGHPLLARENPLVLINHLDEPTSFRYIAAAAPTTMRLDAATTNCMSASTLTMVTLVPVAPRTAAIR